VGSKIIDKGILDIQEVEDEVFVPNGLDLVPYRPTIHAVMLKVLAENLQRREEVNVSPVVQSAPQAQSGGLNTFTGPTVSLFHRRGIPSSAQPNGSLTHPGVAIMFRPILVDRGVVQNQVATKDIAPSSRLEIVQWRPCLHALALQL